MGIKENFKKDLEEWQAVELLFGARMFWLWHRISWPEDWYFPDYDLIVDWIMYEVKFDRQQPQTGNVAIEVSYKWKPSWLMRTKAQKIIYYISDEFWCINTDKLKELIKDYKVIHWGDNNESELVLMSTAQVKKHFTLLFN